MPPFYIYEKHIYYIMAQESREETILNEIQKIKSSKQTVRTYFETNNVPFSREQYYRYCKILKKYGEDGLRDKRIDGNRTILTDRIKDYIIYTVSENRSKIGRASCRERV